VESGGFDRLVIAVNLHCAADAGGPERGVAGDAFGQLDGGDDVGDGEAAAGAQRVSCRGEHAVLVGGQVDHAVGDHAVDGAGLDGRFFDVAVPELHSPGGEPSCLVELGGGHVDANDRAG